MINSSCFSKSRILKYMSRQLFVFLGILSHSTFGDEYLTEKKFYTLMKKGLNHGSKFDYLFSLLVDNISFNSKGAIELIEEIVKIGSKRMKRYVFEHVRCLMKFGKEIEWHIGTFINCMVSDNEVAHIVVNVLLTLMDNPANVRALAKYLDSLETLQNSKKELIYILLRDPLAIEKFSESVEEELRDLNIPSLVEDFSEQLETNYKNTFPFDDNRNERYFLTINLPKVASIYNSYSEYYWIKQLPFNFNFGILNNENKHNNYRMLSAYLEYHDNNKLILYTKIYDVIKINIKTQSIKFICMIGDSTVDKNCRFTVTAEFLNFEPFDFKNMRSFSKGNQAEQFYKIEKEGVVINFKRELYSHDPSEFILYSIYAYVQIRPCRWKFN